MDGSLHACTHADRLALRLTDRPASTAQIRSGELSECRLHMRESDEPTSDPHRSAATAPAAAAPQLFERDVHCVRAHRQTHSLLCCPMLCTRHAAPMLAHKHIPWLRYHETRQVSARPGLAPGLVYFAASLEHASPDGRRRNVARFGSDG
jgi:hypothetical protein